MVLKERHPGHNVNRQSLLSGLNVITDQHLMPRDRFVEMVDAAVRNGAKIVQLREKHTPPEEIARLGQSLLSVTRRYGALLLINDDPEIAHAIGADGVHVGREDATVPEARVLLGPDAIIGVTCYGQIERAVAAVQEGADYVAFGTPFPSPTKGTQGKTPLTIYREVKQHVSVPVFAIGGINAGNAQQIRDAGADAISVVSGVFGAPDVGAAAKFLATMFT
ncbi:thiamine phosphate synthase [Candidatus Entotheonella palauensis]|nr:thiamine phosphate synthase [Candidatus Entotheonella palauensis]